MSIRTLAASIGLAWALAAAPAGAQSAADVAAARDLFREASQLAKEGKWPEARERLERSLRLKRASLTMYSLGIAQKNTGQLVEALESFRAFLAEPSAPTTKSYEPSAKEAIGELEKKVSRISMKISPPDAPDLLVKVDGQPVPAAVLDRPRLVNPGAHEVTAAARGFAETRQSVTVAEGGSGSVDLVLTPDADAPAPVVPAPTASAAPVTSGPAPSGPAEARPSRVVPIVFIGGGALAIAGGATFGALGLSQAKDAPTSDGSDADSARTKGIVADVLLGVGVVAVGVGVVLWIAGGSKKGAASTGQHPVTALRF